MNPVDLNRLMWLALGAGSKGVIGGVVSGFVPEGAEIAPDIATAVIGFIIAQQGGDRVGTFGEGMLIASIGQIVRQPIEALFERFKPEEEEKKTKTNRLVEGDGGGGGGLSNQEQYLVKTYGFRM